MGFKNKTFLNNFPPQLEDDDLNGYKDEFNNVISSSGQTPLNAILDQTAKAVASYAARGDFYTDSGSANIYVLSSAGGQTTPISYEVGMRIRFVPANDNTGASTINVATLGVKNIKNAGGTDPASGQLSTGKSVELFYDGTDFIITTFNPTILAEEVATAWVNFDGTGTVTIRDDLNISSVTDNGVGDYTPNFSTALADSNFSVCGTAQITSGSRATSGLVHPVSITTTHVDLTTIQIGASFVDCDIVSMATFGGN